jgi:predicted esterase
MLPPLLVTACLFAAAACAAGADAPPPIEVHLPRQEGDPHTATVIFLHGLGDTGQGWQSTARRLATALPHIKFILPTAPERAVTMNRGRVMTAWYDIAALPRGGTHAPSPDMVGIADAAATVERIAADELARFGIPRSRVVVGGFSQGATVSLFTGLSNAGGRIRGGSSNGEGTEAEEDDSARPSVFAGVVALSG